MQHVCVCKNGGSRYEVKCVTTNIKRDEIINWQNSCLAFEVRLLLFRLFSVDFVLPPYISLLFFSCRIYYSCTFSVKPLAANLLRNFIPCDLFLFLSVRSVGWRIFCCRYLIFNFLPRIFKVNFLTLVLLPSNLLLSDFFL